MVIAPLQTPRMRRQLTCRAVWTRFHPIAYAVQDVLKSGRLGKVHRMFADFSMNFEPDSKSSTVPAERESMS